MYKQVEDLIAREFHGRLTVREASWLARWRAASSGNESYYHGLTALLEAVGSTAMNDRPEVPPPVETIVSMAGANRSNRGHRVGRHRVPPPFGGILAAVAGLAAVAIGLQLNSDNSHRATQIAESPRLLVGECAHLRLVEPSNVRAARLGAVEVDGPPYLVWEVEPDAAADVDTPADRLLRDVRSSSPPPDRAVDRCR